MSIYIYIYIIIYHITILCNYAVIYTVVRTWLRTILYVLRSFVVFKPNPTFKKKLIDYFGWCEGGQGLYTNLYTPKNTSFALQNHGPTQGQFTHTWFACKNTVLLCCLPQSFSSNNDLRGYSKNDGTGRQSFPFWCWSLLRRNMFIFRGGTFVIILKPQNNFWNSTRQLRLVKNHPSGFADTIKTPGHPHRNLWWRRHWPSG